jgi:hypothetical protein
MQDPAEIHGSEYFEHREPHRRELGLQPVPAGVDQREEPHGHGAAVWAGLRLVG